MLVPLLFSGSNTSGLYRFAFTVPGFQFCVSELCAVLQFDCGFLVFSLISVLFEIVCVFLHLSVSGSLS